MTDTPLPDLLLDTEQIRYRAMQSLFESFDSLCEGTVVVDKDARIVWINDAYARRFGAASSASALGQEVEKVIPHSLMRQVVTTGQPILLDLLETEHDTFVVTRIPIKDSTGAVIGAAGFALFDQVESLKPFFAKIERMQRELAAAQKRLAEDRRPKYSFSNFIGTSPACMEVKRQARRAAQLDATVLLLGETGTGKELLAHAIHAASFRAGKPFVGVNVAAIPETLLETEFFGAAPGAYTGADRRGREGKFLLADGGTLFLDEIGDMPLALQAKLLRVLQEQEFEAVGSNRVIRVDVRIIAATSVNLQQLVDEGRFRADLYYRLNVLSILLPPLRERTGDMEALCEHILEQIAQRTGVSPRELTADAVERLRGYPWKGNIRELRNVLEKATMLSEQHRLDSADFDGILPAAVLPVGKSDPAGAVRPYAAAFEDFERRLLTDAMAAAKGKVDEAARMLGLGCATLYRKLGALGFLSQN
ncbi:MAG TPA: sigma 54-interacting transcriptional regulator [Rhodocyclaceae bacterium]|nr:sigma 54-interacting transcriptional regulator [Rhodocyclaceae bacterium]